MASPSVPLSNDILTQVVEYLSHNFGALNSCSTANKQLHAVSKRYLHARLKIHGSDKRCKGRLEFYQSRPDLVQYIHSICIEKNQVGQYWYDNDAPPQPLAEAFTLLRAMHFPSLKALHFNEVSITPKNQPLYETLPYFEKEAPNLTTLTYQSVGPDLTRTLSFIRSFPLLSCLKIDNVADDPHGAKDSVVTPEDVDVDSLSHLRQLHLDLQGLSHHLVDILHKRVTRPQIEHATVHVRLFYGAKKKDFLRLVLETFASSYIKTLRLIVGNQRAELGRYCMSMLSLTLH